ncbi:hypothetical protein SLS53_002301 [Cytospora paraplurivora]|uniref:Uncharacterized protein n=1 Tax=Cytospora paraplurivora TaxID=2898453 RepID=A0AAN9YKN0_9PEZI
MDSKPHTDAVPTNGRLPDAGSAQSRKQLNPKLTARKTAGFTFPPAKSNGAKTNGTNIYPANRIHTNNPHPSPKPAFLGQVGKSPPDSPSGKRQRISSPKADDKSPRFARPVLPVLPTREVSASNGKNSILNGRDRGSSLPDFVAGSLFLGKEDEEVSTRSSSQDTNIVSANGFGSGLKSVLTPINTESVSNGRILGAAELISEPRELNHAKRGSTSARVTPLEKPQRRGPTPTNSKKREKIAKSPYSTLNVVTRTPPLEKQRRHLAETLDSSALDRFIYGQEASSEPPPGVEKPPQQEQKKREDLYYVNIDPRTHWTRPHSDEWYKKKEEEIKARGGRKANLGKAAQRMREQKSKEDPDAWEQNLPDRVRNNEAWLGAMRWFHIQEQGDHPSGSSQATGHVSPPVRKKRPYRRRNQVAIPKAEGEPSVAPGRSNSGVPNSDTEVRFKRGPKL